MKKEELTKLLYEKKMEGLKEGLKHASPSGETRKALSEINKKLERLKDADQIQDIAYTKSDKDIVYIKETMIKGFKRLEDCIKKQNNSCFIHGKEISDRFEEVNEEIRKINKWRDEASGALNLGKWILGFIGMSTLINILIAIINHYAGN